MGGSRLIAFSILGESEQPAVRHANGLECSDSSCPDPALLGAPSAALLFQEKDAPKASA